MFYKIFKDGIEVGFEKTTVDNNNNLRWEYSVDAENWSSTYIAHDEKRELILKDKNNNDVFVGDKIKGSFPGRRENVTVEFEGYLRFNTDTMSYMIINDNGNMTLTRFTELLIIPE